MGVLRIGDVYRYSRPYSPAPEYVDGLRNYFSVSFTPGQKLPLLEAGINPIQTVRSINGERCPAVLIRSSPHKVGSQTTPWQDVFDVDYGHIRYYGDNKKADRQPHLAPGNAALLAQFKLHTSPEPAVRATAAPIIFFRGVRQEARVKGNVQFQGFGILTTVQLVTQLQRRSSGYFTNYLYECCVMSLTDDDEVFNWDWVSARRDPICSNEQALRNAPASWRLWVREGTPAIERCRRRVSRLMTTSSAEQKPPPGSAEERILNEILAFYCNKKAQFEALASVVTGSILRRTGACYREGWITPASSDGGADFVGRIDLGSGFGRTSLIVLGQAKCEEPSQATGGNHIARTVARLRRGWVAAYVTTSYFSDPVQREIIEDEYPILLVNGAQLAHEVSLLQHSGGYPSVTALLESVDSRYETLKSVRRPHEILHD
jgi:hypothetical protein